MELKSIEELTQLLHLLPGIGMKSAERMAYQFLQMDDETLEAFSNSLLSLHKKVQICPICGAYMEDNNCSFCSDETRDKDKIIVVSSYKDALAFENLKIYHGLYHILGGNISPTRGIGPEEIRIKSLFDRLNPNINTEIILATDPTVDGETTALYIAKLFENQKNVSVTRLAYGLPMGGHLTYADELTLLRSFQGRKQL